MKCLLALVAMTSVAAADGLRLSPEVDPLPFIQGGYGTQLGFRDDRIARIRVAPASFSLDVPDFAAQLGNDDFHLRVRPSFAVYVWYFLSPKRNSFAVGGSMRFLRLRYTHDAFPDESMDTLEISPEVIVGYKWHPSRFGFYVQPWFGLSTMLYRTDDAVVGDRKYDPLPVQAFFTVNLGWELVL